MFGCTPADGAHGTSVRPLGGSLPKLRRFPARAEVADLLLSSICRVVNLLRRNKSATRYADHARAALREAGASANCAALHPASRPKVAPDIRPVPLA
jgi:hypothetical protein